MLPTEVTETEKNEDVHFARSVLERYERSKILEIYFSRLDGREPEYIDVEVEDLYKVDLESIKSFLLGQHPHDTLLQKIFRIMN